MPGEREPIGLTPELELVLERLANRLEARMAQVEERVLAKAREHADVRVDHLGRNLGLGLEGITDRLDEHEAVLKGRRDTPGLVGRIDRHADRLALVEKIVYGVVTLVLVAVGTAVVALVVHTGGRP